MTHGRAHLSKVSVVCLVVQEISVLADVSPPCLEDASDAQSTDRDRLSLSENLQPTLPQQVVASVDVKSVHAQLCSQDRQCSGLSPQVSRVCFALDTPFGQFGDRPEVHSSILFEIGIERVHVAFQSTNKLCVEEPPPNLQDVLTELDALSTRRGRHQSVLANPAAVLSVDQDVVPSPEVITSSPRSAPPPAARSSSVPTPPPPRTFNEVKILGNIAGIWVQLPSAPCPQDAVSGHELPINFLSAVNLMLDIWQVPVSNLVIRAKQIAEEADQIRSHAVCLLLQELLICGKQDTEVSGTSQYYNLCSAISL